MNGNCGYVSRLLRSWPIPVCGLLVIATHWLIEALVQVGFSRGNLIMVSLFLCPLIISTLVRKRRGAMGAIINGSYLILTYSAFMSERGWAAAKRELIVFLVVLAFGLVCAVAAGGFHERLSRRFSKGA